MLERILAVQIPQFVFILFYRYLYYEICLQTSNQDNETIKQVAWVGFWGPAQGLEKIFAHRKQTKKSKIKDSHNGTRMGASNIFWGNQLRFQISAQ